MDKLVIDQKYYDIAEAAIERGALQNRNEFAATLYAVDQVRPETLLEIGCHVGGSLWAWQQLGIPSITGITKEQTVRPQNREGITIHLTDSTQSVLGYHTKPDVVLVDGGHDYETARMDWDNHGKWAKKLSIFHDTNNRAEYPEIESWKVWETYILPSLKPNTRYTVYMDSTDSPGTGIVWNS